MALFKISRGLKANLPSTLTEGYCWYTYNDSKFYIDYKDENGTLVRKALNAQDAETLTGASLSTILNSSDIEIPTSKAVLDALNGKADIAHTHDASDITGLTNDLNLKNGEGACSLEQTFVEDGQVKGSKAYGKYSTALNQSNETYQRNSFATGGGTIVGLTEEEFNAKYPDGVDKWGSTYDKSNSFANAGGQENRVTGRGSHIGGGRLNEVHGDYSGVLAGDTNIVNGDYSGINAGSNNTIDSNNSSVFDGKNVYINGNCSGGGGDTIQIETANTHAFGSHLTSNKRPDTFLAGRYNNKDSYALFQVGTGWYNEETDVTHRRNSFEVFENGVSQFNEETRFVSKVDFSEASIDGLNASNTGAVSGPISNGNLVEWSDEHQALIDSNIDISNYINPAVPGVKVGTWTDEILAGKVDLSSQKLVFDPSIITSAQLAMAAFNTTGGYQLTGTFTQVNQLRYMVISYLVNPDGSTTGIGGALRTNSSVVQWSWDESMVTQRADGLYEFTLPADFGTIIPETVTLTVENLQAFSYITHNMSELIGDALLLNDTLISAPEESGTLATQEWVQAQGYGDDIEITADAINNALVGQNLFASTLGTTQGIIAVGGAGQIKENSDGVPYVTIDSGTGGALDVTSDGAYFNEKPLATQEWVESQGFGGEIDTTADYNWVGDHTFEGSIAVEGSIDFTSATITGLPTFSFDAATGTLTIIAPTNN